MNKEALIAIIVPIYNAERYLEICIQSILNQTYKNLEIILVDDGSTDKSFSICKIFSKKDKRIKLFHKENGGPLSAKKVALEAAKAEYIMFVDADDWIKPEMCEKLYTTMIKENVDLVTSGIIRYFSENNCIYDTDILKEGKYFGKDYHELIVAHMLCDGVFPRRGVDASLAVKMFKRRILLPVLNKADKEYGYLYAEDTAVLYPYMLQAVSVYISKDCYYFHRQYEDGHNYYEDTDFEHKVRKLYFYLQNIFEKNSAHEILMKQLDYFVYGLFMAKCEVSASKIVRRSPKLQQYLFPFHRVESGSRIILYGAGAVGQSFYAQLKKTAYCREIIWQDKQYQKYQMEKLPVDCVNMKMKADKCVIAVQDEETAYEIRKQLIRQGMEEEKIVWENPLLHMW